MKDILTTHTHCQFTGSAPLMDFAATNLPSRLTSKTTENINQKQLKTSIKTICFQSKI